jgi:hypothetical protein
MRIMSAMARGVLESGADSPINEHFRDVAQRRITAGGAVFQQPG